MKFDISNKYVIMLLWASKFAAPKVESVASKWANEHLWW